jgi:Kef-type K+ transport system membrane component KefB
MRRLSPRLSRLATGSSGNPLFAVAIALCFALSALASVIGLAAIIGAFFAGIIFAEIREAPELRRSMAPIYDLLVPIFFVLMGTRVDAPRLLTLEVLPVGLLITAIAIIGKLGACGLAAYRLGWRDALAVGVGMTPRGEVGIVVALIGLSRGMISGDIYAQVILMSVLTSLFAPSLLRLLLVPPVPDSPAEPATSDNH